MSKLLSNFDFNLQEETLVISLLGTIADSDMDFFPEQLVAGGDFESIHLRIHSLGGSAWTAFALFNLLLEQPAPVSCEIIGVCASAATYIAMAADKGKISIAENGFFMVHNPYTTAKIGVLEAMAKENYIKAYQRHSSLSAEELGNAMDTTTWYSAQTAITAGFAQNITHKSLDLVACANSCDLPNIPTSLLAQNQPKEKHMDELYTLLALVGVEVVKDDQGKVSSDALAKISTQLKAMQASSTLLAQAASLLECDANIEAMKGKVMALKQGADKAAKLQVKVDELEASALTLQRNKLIDKLFADGKILEGEINGWVKSASLEMLAEFEKTAIPKIEKPVDKTTLPNEQEDESKADAQLLAIGAQCGFTEEDFKKYSN